MQHRASPLRRNTESGAALVITIFVLAVLVALVVSISQSARVELKASRNFATEVQCRALATPAFTWPP